jgi:transketolase
VTVLYATSIEPFDAQTLVSAVGARPLVIMVEPWYQGTMTATIAEALSPVPSRIVSIGVPKRFPTAYGSPAEHDAANGLDERGIRRQVEEALASGADLGPFAV